MMKWNNLTRKQRVLWVVFWITTLVSVGVLGVMIYKQLVGEEVTVHNWFSITLATSNLMFAYFALTHSKKTSES